ncbi:peptidase M23 [Ligilactobacillus salivarius]|uniref:M23 family metallopeptidase n=1 Tax=Ligilactobacillus salivarius TaxID=1624 RepID=UPI000BB0A786|nr:M23 family metallopeptidase [Ligilactobacillus salivarius]PAY50910.1 peptidase M23 [Ligilactobacillus salivarius]PAY55899.1 peptidase M23 [Ligilactobacillus salivarius]
MASAVLASIGITGMMQNKHISKTAMIEHKSVQKATVQHNTFFSKVSADTINQTVIKGISNSISPFPNVSVNDLQISSGMGWRSIGGVQYHQGWDLPAIQGTPVLATNNGVVSYTGFLPDQGNVVIVYFQESNTAVYFQHLASITVSKGQQVTSGQQVGTVGGTGVSPDYNSYAPHLHIGAFKNASNYINNAYPMPSLPTNSETAATTDFISPAEMFGIDDNQNNWIDEQTNMYGSNSEQPASISDGNNFVTVGQALQQIQ